jgi:hypothetical protein
MYLATTFDLEIEKMDVKIMLLHEELEEEIYMKQLEGYPVNGKNALVCKLQISLYGLKQLRRTWYQKFDTCIFILGFVRSKPNQYVYSKEQDDHFIYVALYADEMSLDRNNMDAIKEVKKQLYSKFDMEDLGATNFNMGMEIKRDWAVGKLWLNQRKYIETILKRFNVQYCKPIKVAIRVGEKLIVVQCPKMQQEVENMTHVPYASVVGSLMYAMVYNRP